MYARLLRFRLKPDSWSAVEKIDEVVVPLIKAQPGFKGVTLFGDDAEGECGLFVLWDSENEANLAAAVVGPHLQAALMGAVEAPPDIRLMPVVRN